MGDFIGKWPLGYKEAGSNEDGLLGFDYFTTVNDTVQGRDLSLYPTRVYVKWVKNTGGTALQPGQAVQIDVTGDMAYAVTDITTAGTLACGIVDPTLSEDVAAGEKFLIVTEGLVDVLTGAVLAKGTHIGVGTNGVAIASGTPFGEMVEASTISGQLRRAFVSFRASDFDGTQSIVAAAAEGATNTILPSSTGVIVTGVTVDANDFVVLPPIASVPTGHRITVIGRAGSNFEVRTPASSNTLINNVDSDGTQEYLFTNLHTHFFTKISNTVGWIGNGLTNLGAVVTAVVPD